MLYHRDSERARDAITRALYNLTTLDGTRGDIDKLETTRGLLFLATRHVENAAKIAKLMEGHLPEPERGEPEYLEIEEDTLREEHHAALRSIEAILEDVERNLADGYHARARASAASGLRRIRQIRRLLPRHTPHEQFLQAAERRFRSVLANEECA